MSELFRFGNPGQFEIAARWLNDSEPRERLPVADGWSTGELRITVCGQVLTEHRFRGRLSSNLSWYLSPVIDWLIRNWACLLHEESFGWPEKSAQPAAVATFSALERYIASPTDTDSSTYQKVHDWWSRHALRAADSSAIYPDIYFRRVADDIEISWLARQPGYAPDDFSLTLGPGFALLSVGAVATALWKFLDWATASAPATNAADQLVVDGLRSRFASLSNTPVSELEQCYVGPQLQLQLDAVRKSIDLANDRRLVGNLPVIESLDSAVLMFGGLNVDIEQADIRCLLSFLASQKGQVESDVLAELVGNPQSEVWLRPHEEGYGLALDCREDLGIEPDRVFIDIDDVLTKLSVTVQEEALSTRTVRGVAVAGQGFGPGILINTNSAYNNNEPGRRFTLTHEFCHILYDRTRAKKLSHLSGPWTSGRTEKRANAFAAMFLAPPSAIRKRLVDHSPDAVRQLANDVGMGVTALIEHLYNFDLIDDAEREQLKQYFVIPEQFD